MMSRLRKMASEKEIRGISGWLIVFVVLAVVVAGIYCLIELEPPLGATLGCVAVMVVSVLCLAGLTVVNPNQASVLTLFGVYKGTIKHAGLWWVNPLTTRRK